MAAKEQILSHWHVLVDQFRTSAVDCYSAVERALSERQIPDLKVKRITYHEAGFLSAKREYLRVSRGSLTYDICAAPYGTGFFFSSWMLARAPLPIIGWLHSVFVKPLTRYEYDSRLMFQDSVHRALTDTINALGTAQGLRALTPEEARPMMSAATR